MKIGKIDRSIITEKGDINNPKMNNYVNRKKIYKEPNFWKGFLIGVFSSLVASFIYQLIIP